MTTDSSSETAAVRDLPEEFATVIHRLAAWWSAPPPPPRIPRTLVWGGRDLGSVGHRLHVEGNELRLELVSQRPAEGAAFARRPFEELWKQPLEGTTEDGWTFTAKQAYVTSWTASGRGREREQLVSVCGRDWTLVGEAGRSQFWVGEISGEPRVYLGNLILSAGRSAFSRGHYLFAGPDCDYALVAQGREKDRWLLVVHERSAGVLTHEILRRDMIAISFALGSALGLGHVWSVDADLRLRAVLGGDIASRTRKGMTEEAPVPSTNDLNALPAVMFEKFASYLAARTNEENAQPVLACWYYLESLAEASAEGALIKIALAAVVMARHVLKNDVALVVDRPGFLAWLAASEDTVAALEHPERAAMLRAQLVGGWEASASSAIRIALASAGVGVPREIADALTAAEQALSGQPGADMQFYKNFARLRSVLAALVARAVGYTGRIAGWERAGEYSFFEPAPADWWPADETVSATAYRAAAPEPTPDVASLWPSVDLPSVPSSGLIGLLARHAAGLASRSDGRVYADLEPLPLDSPGAKRRYELALRPAKRPTTKITLFIVRPAEDDAISIDGWDESVTLRTPADVEVFLNKLRDAPGTAAALERLLLAALEEERRAAR